MTEPFRCRAIEGTGVKRLFGRCFLIVSCGSAQRDDLVNLIIVVERPNAPLPRSGSELDRISSGSPHDPRTQVKAARS
jgi:hypothetical protein